MFTMQQAERTALVITYCNQMIIVKHLLLVVTSVVITSCQSKANAGWMEKGATPVQLVLSVVAAIWLHAWVSYTLLLSFLLASLLQHIRVFGGSFVLDDQLTREIYKSHFSLGCCDPSYTCIRVCSQPNGRPLAQGLVSCCTENRFPLV